MIVLHLLQLMLLYIFPYQFSICVQTFPKCLSYVYIHFQFAKRKLTYFYRFVRKPLGLNIFFKGIVSFIRGICLRIFFFFKKSWREGSGVELEQLQLQSPCEESSIMRPCVRGFNQWKYLRLPTDPSLHSQCLLLNCETQSD